MIADPYARIVSLANMFVGVVETGPNQGPLIKLFQEAVDGKAEGEPWCVAFLQFLIKQIDQEIWASDKTWPFAKLAKTESCMRLWDNSPQACRVEKPRPGLIVVWQHYAYFSKENRWIKTSMGHAGVIIKVNDDGTMETVEGNTSKVGTDIERSGDGCWIKTRHHKIDTGTMRTLGFLTPWPNYPLES